MTIAATKTRIYTAAAQAPRPGKYKLAMDVSGEAGWIVPAKTFSTTSTLRVWPRTPKPTLAHKGMRGDEADFAVVVDVGRDAPHGVMCEVTVKGAAIAFDPGSWRSLEPTTLGRYLQAGAGDSAMFRLRWSRGSTVAQKTVAVEFSLSGPSGTSWHDLAKQANVDCTTLKEKSDVVV